jgi:hypothetical protein
MAIPEGGPGTGSEPEPTPKKSREKCPRRVPDPPALPHVSGSKTLVTLRSEKNVNLAHTYTLVGGSGIAIPELPLTRFPGQDPGGSGAWNRPQKLRSGPGPGQGPGPVLGPGPGIPDPLPRDGDPRPQVRRSGPGSRIGDRSSRSRVDRCYRSKAMLDIVRERSSSEDRELLRARASARGARERPRCDAVMVLADAELGRIFKT